MRYYSTLLCCLLLAPVIVACCGVGRTGKPIVNADQTVIIVWDEKQKLQHFIRKASFATKDNDFGFIIPSPTEPELAESSDDAFSFLLKVTSPEIIARSSGCGLGCGVQAKSAPKSTRPDVVVLKQQEVAGFDASVLEAKSGKALTTWLEKHGYVYSPEVAAWAQPYIDQGWKFTALKISTKATADKHKEAKALRMSFKTEQPLFPYREPSSASFAKELGQTQRLLRIYFLADKRYEGELTNAKGVQWEGNPVWAGKLTTDQRSKLFDYLKLKTEQMPATLFLTEYEDLWKYRDVASDLYFKLAANQDMFKRDPVVAMNEPSTAEAVWSVAIVGVIFVPWLWRKGNRVGK